MRAGKLTLARLFLSTMVAITVCASGIERIDLFSGAGPFSFTPFVAVAPLMIMCAVAHKLFGRRQLDRPPVRGGGAMVFAFVVVAFIGSANSASDKSLSRWALLALLCGSAWATIYIVRSCRSYRGLRFGALLGLLVYVVLDIVQWFHFQQYGLADIGFIGPYNPSVIPYGSGVVRLAGGSLDPNRAAATVATFAYILLGDPVARMRGSSAWALSVAVLCTALVGLTLSRSGIALFVIVMFGGILAILRDLRPLQRAGIAVILFAAAIWGVIEGWLESLDLGSIASSRLDLDSGSALDHFSLLSRGMSVFTEGGADPLVGAGWGSSYLFLQDMFSDNSYGNFHSLYVTVLVESGLIGGVLLLAVLAIPMRTSRIWLSLGVLTFGLFYQSTSDPVFWLQLALLWGLPSILPFQESTNKQSEKGVNVALKDPEHSASTNFYSGSNPVSYVRTRPYRKPQHQCRTSDAWPDRTPLA